MVIPVTTAYQIWVHSLMGISLSLTPKRLTTTVLETREKAWLSDQLQLYIIVWGEEVCPLVFYSASSFDEGLGEQMGQNIMCFNM